MNLTPPDRMEPAAIVAEINTLHQELQSRVARIHGLSQSLYQRVRRAPANDNTAIYMRFATTWSRFAGMAGQGIKRASVGARILKGLTPEPAAAESIVKPPIKQAPVASTPVESLLNMYGEDSDLTDGVIQAVVDGDASGAE
jgi:hypothetical protein